MTREQVAAVVYKMHGCSCETHDSNGMSATCARWRQVRADQIAATLVPQSADPRVEKVRGILTDPASRELAEGRGVDVEDVEALLAAYDEATDDASGDPEPSS